MIDAYVENEQDEIEISNEIAECIKRAVKTVMEYENRRFDAEAYITITDNERIRAINKEYRDKDAPTDVLSFPMLEFGENTDISELDKNPQTGMVILGDIVISAEKAAAQAEEYGHSFLREIAFLTIHSMLHLLGYDHEKGAEDERIMRDKEKDILKLMGISRN